MREVEVKARIHDLSHLIGELARIGCELNAVVQQKDTVYVPKGMSIPVPENTNVLRLREQAGKVLLTLKIPKTNQLDCIEKELEISDASEMEAIILLLGFEKASFTEKFRRKGTVGDLEICVDSVTDLGDFIEVEKLVDESAGEGVQTELLAFLKSLGVVEADQVFEGYDILLGRKLGIITK